MTTWGDFRTQLRRSVLNDTPEVNWSDDVLRDLCWWALDTFCAHTAVATSVEYPATGSTYDLPANQFESVETAGLVYLETSSGTRTYLPVYYEPDRASTDLTYEEFPDGTLRLSDTPSDTSDTLVVRYFAYYNHPYADADLIGVPPWAESALGYLIGALAMSRHMSSAALIDQWNDRTDSGNPEHNPMRLLQREFMLRYEHELTRRSRQERINLWKRSTT